MNEPIKITRGVGRQVIKRLAKIHEDIRIDLEWIRDENAAYGTYKNEEFEIIAGPYIVRCRLSVSESCECRMRLPCYCPRLYCSGEYGYKCDISVENIVVRDNEKEAEVPVDDTEKKQIEIEIKHCLFLNSPKDMETTFNTD